jgi:hypothetical protein
MRTILLRYHLCPLLWPPLECPPPDIFGAFGSLNFGAEYFGSLKLGSLYFGSLYPSPPNMRPLDFSAFSYDLNDFESSDWNELNPELRP